MSVMSAIKKLYFHFKRTIKTYYNFKKKIIYKFLAKI